MAAMAAGGERRRAAAAKFDAKTRARATRRRLDRTPKLTSSSKATPPPLAASSKTRPSASTRASRFKTLHFGLSLAAASSSHLTIASLLPLQLDFKALSCRLAEAATQSRLAGSTSELMSTDTTAPRAFTTSKMLRSDRCRSEKISLQHFESNNQPHRDPQSTPASQPASQSTTSFIVPTTVANV